MKRKIQLSVLVTITFASLLSWHGCIIDTERLNTVSDRDGNRYVVVKIGTQSWMGSNLKTTQYSDGTDIPMVSNQNEWIIPKVPAMCWYDNNEDFKELYGGLYNFYVIDTADNGGKNLCPSGWHVPTLEDWDILIEFLGGYSDAGDALKDNERGEWNDFYLTLNNPKNFTALPAGYRTGNGDFAEKGNWAVWWSSTEKTSTTASGIMIADLYSNISLNEKVSKNIGTSIRCIKD